MSTGRSEQARRATVQANGRNAREVRGLRRAREAMVREYEMRGPPSWRSYGSIFERLPMQAGGCPTRTMAGTEQSSAHPRSTPQNPWSPTHQRILLVVEPRTQQLRYAGPRLWPEGALPAVSAPGAIDAVPCCRLRWLEVPGTGGGSGQAGYQLLSSGHWPKSSRMTWDGPHTTLGLGRMQSMLISNARLSGSSGCSMTRTIAQPCVCRVGR